MVCAIGCKLRDDHISLQTEQGKLLFDTQPTLTSPSKGVVVVWKTFGKPITHIDTILCNIDPKTPNQAQLAGPTIKLYDNGRHYNHQTLILSTGYYDHYLARLIV